MDRLFTKKQLLEGRDFDDLDLMEVFIRVYSQWVKDRFGIDSSQYPFSYLLKKYTRKFFEEVMGDTFETDDDVPELDRWEIPRIVAKLLEKGKVSIPSLQPKEKLTEMYPEAISMFLKRLQLPSYAKLKIEEKTPFSITISPSIDFREMMLSPGQQPFLNSSNLSKKLESYIVRYMGLETGRPSHGEIEFDHDEMEYLNYEYWKKNVFDKVLKKGLKEIPNGDQIRSFRLEPKSNKLVVKVSFKGYTYGIRRDLKNAMISYLEQMGYTPDKFEFEF